jgi:hypothetical protein
MKKKLQLATLPQAIIVNTVLELVTVQLNY